MCIFFIIKNPTQTFSLYWFKEKTSLFFPLRGHAAACNGDSIASTTAHYILHVEKEKSYKISGEYPFKSFKKVESYPRRSWLAPVSKKKGKSTPLSSMFTTTTIGHETVGKKTWVLQTLPAFCGLLLCNEILRETAPKNIILTLNWTCVKSYKRLPSQVLFWPHSCANGEIPSNNNRDQRFLIQTFFFVCHYCHPPPSTISVSNLSHTPTHRRFDWTSHAVL